MRNRFARIAAPTHSVRIHDLASRRMEWHAPAREHALISTEFFASSLLEHTQPLLL